MGPRRRRRVAIVGAGITGLAAAHALERARGARGDDATPEYVVLEAGERAGGNLFTERVEGCLLDAGPDGFVVTKPHAEALCRELGLGAELVETVAANRRVYVATARGLVPMPEGMLLAVPTRVGPIARTPLLSPAAKARMALDLVLPPRRGDGDESLSGFVARRLGVGAAELFADALMAGIYAGDPDALSVRATFPQLVALEREHGSLIRGVLATRGRRPARATPASPFLALRAGMGALVDALVARLAPGALRARARVVALERTSGEYALRLRVEGAGDVDADAVLVAAPARVAAALVAPHDEDAALALGEVPVVSTAAAFLAYDRAQIAHALDATGFVAPRRAGLPITASTWASSKWPGRAPEGTALLRVFFGHARDPEAALRDDAALLADARAALARTIGARGEPRFTRVYRYPRANPQMTLGHGARMARVRARLARLGAPVLVAGGGYDGVGIPDCVKQGEAAARELLERDR